MTLPSPLAALAAEPGWTVATKILEVPFVCRVVGFNMLVGVAAHDEDDFRIEIINKRHHRSVTSATMSDPELAARIAKAIAAAFCLNATTQEPTP